VGDFGSLSFWKFTSTGAKNSNHQLVSVCGSGAPSAGQLVTTPDITMAESLVTQVSRDGKPGKFADLAIDVEEQATMET
jgi:hypothetical protein